MTNAVVVGSGVAGALVGWKLAKAGMNVTILEAGPPQDRDVAVATFRAATAKVPESPYPNTPWAPRPSVLEIGVPGTGYFIQNGPDPFGSTYERIVGGTTWHWLGSCPRLLPSDFNLHSLFGVGVDWPITYNELEPWYVRAEVAIGVAGNSAVDQGSPRSAPFPMEEIPTSYLDGIIAKAAATLGLEVLGTPQARNSETYNDRHHCVGNSNCIPVCPIGAKYDALIHLDLAREHGAKIIPNAVVHDILVSNGRATGVVYRKPDKSNVTVLADIVILAANAIETPKIMLMANGGAGVGNSSDMVGRNLMDHPIKLSYALSDEPVFGQRGPLSTAGIESTRQAATRGDHSAFRVEIGNDGWKFPIGDPTFEFTAQPDGAGTFVQLREGGNALRDRWRDHVTREFRFGSLTEQLPNPENRIVPDFANVDAIGIPRPRISFTIGRYVNDGAAEAEALHERLFEAMNATDRHHVPFLFGAGHIIGTTNMGNDPHTSVVDRDCRSHDVPNMFIAGSSVFPTEGTANPTLTLAALALRTADTILH
jgi:choline dehydrogenase-like flavoprotein